MGVRYVSLCKTKNVSNDAHTGVVSRYQRANLFAQRSPTKLGVAMRLVLLCMSILDIMLLYDASTGTP
jgi:hypothetical protein